TLVSVMDVHGVGPDAIMVEREEALVLNDASPMSTLPKGKLDLLGAKVITEYGQLLGKVSAVFLSLIEPFSVIYEVRSSILDKLLGHAFCFPASLACARSADGSA